MVVSILELLLAASVPELEQDTVVIRKNNINSVTTIPNLDFSFDKYCIARKDNKMPAHVPALNRKKKCCIVIMLNRFYIFLLGNYFVISMLCIGGVGLNKKELPNLFGQLLICM